MTNGAENSTKWLSRIYSLSLSLIKAVVVSMVELSRSSLYANLGLKVEFSA